MQHRVAPRTAQPHQGTRLAQSKQPQGSPQSLYRTRAGNYSFLGDLNTTGAGRRPDIHSYNHSYNHISSTEPCVGTLLSPQRGVTTIPMSPGATTPWTFGLLPVPVPLGPGLPTGCGFPRPPANPPPPPRRCGRAGGGTKGWQTGLRFRTRAPQSPGAAR